MTAHHPQPRLLHPPAAPYLRWNRLGRLLAAERSDCRGDWASADRWLPPSVGRWAVCTSPRTTTHNQRRQPPQARTHARWHGPQKNGRAREWSRPSRFRSGEGEASSVAALVVARKDTRTRACARPRRRGTRPIWPHAKARQRLGHTGGRGEISVEPSHVVASVTSAWDNAGRSRSFPRHKPSGAAPEGVWIAGDLPAEATHPHDCLRSHEAVRSSDAAMQNSFCIVSSSPTNSPKANPLRPFFLLALKLIFMEISRR